MKKKVYIEGMSCNNCVRHVHEALVQIDGVKDAKVSLEGKFAEIELTHDIEDKTIRDAIEDAGYEVTKIE